MRYIEWRLLSVGLIAASLLAATLARGQSSPDLPGYVPGTPAWVPLIDACMTDGGGRNDCIEALPAEIYAEFLAWEQDGRRRALMRLPRIPIPAKKIAALPRPVSNNAVATVNVADRQFVVSFAGLGYGRDHADTLNATLVLDSETGVWRESLLLPGGVGRLASVAVSVGELAFVFGGYTVAADGAEVSLPWVQAFDPVLEEFSELSPMPVPVDDAVAVTYMDRFVYLISGWHDLGNVNLVQRYDVDSNSWRQATPIPGKAVFGHAGGIIGNRIVYCDGVAVRPYADRSRDFVAHDACYLGIIDSEDSRRIDWRRISEHPGVPRYRMAAAGIDSLNAVVFIGGSENPYNYDGIGYDGEPSEPVGSALIFDLGSMSWQDLSHSGPPTMDHRGLVPLGGRWLTVGGMKSGQEVSNQVIAYKFEAISK